MVSGPGQKRRRELLRVLGHFAGPAVQVLRVVQVDDDGMVRRTILQLEDAAHGGRILRIGAQAIDGLGRKGDEAARSQNLCGLANERGVWVIGLDRDDPRGAVHVPNPHK